MNYLVVPVDFSDVTERVAETAARLARGLCAKVGLIHCVIDYPQFSGAGELEPVMIATQSPIERDFPEQEHLLMSLASSLRKSGVDVDAQLIHGTPADEIVSFADQHDADMIILGSHGHGALYELMVGTVTQTVIHHTTRPVLVVPTETYKEMKAVSTEDWAQSMVTT